MVWKTEDSIAVDRGTVIEEYPFSRIFVEDNLAVFHSLNDYSMGIRDKCIVESVFAGASETVFAYGQTGSGKTHTIFGADQAEPGLLHMFIQDLFAVKWEKRNESKVEIHVRCFEIFGESLADLLEPNLGEETEIFLKTTRYRYQTVRVDSVQDCLQLLYIAEKARTVGASSCNDRSSRSHCVVQFAISNLVLEDQEKYSKGMLSFVDLAGSERATMSTEMRRVASSSMRQVNASLASLVRLLRQLQAGELHESERRQSVLNKLLFDYVQPSCGIWLIFCISQEEEHRDYTVSTLQLASDSRNIRLAAQKHTFMKYDGELVQINPSRNPGEFQRREALQDLMYPKDMEHECGDEGGEMEDLQSAEDMQSAHSGRGRYPDYYKADHSLASRHGRLADDVLCESLLDELEYDSSTTVPSDDASQEDYAQAFYHLRRKYDNMLKKKNDTIDSVAGENKGLRDELHVVRNRLHSLEILIHSEKEFMIRTLSEIYGDEKSGAVPWQDLRQSNKSMR